MERKIVIQIHVNNGEIREILTRLSQRCTSMYPVMVEIGKIVVESVQRNFEEHRSPSGIHWRALSKRYALWKTRKMGRNVSDILILNGILMGSLNRRAEQRRVIIGVGGGARDYAAIHQFGGRAGRKGMASIPPRPYLGIRKSDWKGILRLVSGYLHNKQ